MGTTIELKIVGRKRRARLAAKTVMAQIERLERIFNAFDPTSDLRRYAGGEPGPFAPEFHLVFEAANEWQKLSGGAFNPATGALAELWLRGVERGERPDPIELTQIADAIAHGGNDDRQPIDRHQISREHVFRRQISRQHCNLNAIAKGYIVDAAIDRAAQLRPAASEIVVSAGGDVAHRGSGSVMVGIEDPHRPYDNVKPLMRIGLSNAALATSGSAHRNYEFGDSSYSHVIDPRTGEPVDDVASASVVASDAMTADALATILVVIGANEAEASPLFGDTPWMVVDASGGVAQSQSWAELQLAS